MVLSRCRMLAIIAIAFTSFAESSIGREVWVVRAFTPGVRVDGCTYLFWADDLRFFNTTSRDLRVQLVGVSNGGPRSEARELLVPAGRSHSPREANVFWSPAGTGNAFWVNRLEVPDGVLVSSRAEPSAACGPPCFPCLDGRVFGSLALPVFGSLIGANQPQYHLRTDLGTDGSLASISRVNFGIYNGGDREATATMELRRECDQALIARQTVRIPADAFFQFGGFTNDTLGQTCLSGLRWATYGVVTVDQPSFSYAATLSYDVTRIPVSISSPN